MPLKLDLSDLPNQPLDLSDLPDQPMGKLHARPLNYFFLGISKNPLTRAASSFVHRALPDVIPDIAKTVAERQTYATAGLPPETIGEKVGLGLGSLTGTLPAFQAAGVATAPLGEIAASKTLPAAGRLAAAAGPSLLRKAAAALPRVAERVARIGPALGLTQAAEEIARQKQEEGRINTLKVAEEAAGGTLFGAGLGVVGAGPTRLSRVTRGILFGGIATPGSLEDRIMNAGLFGAFEFLGSRGADLSQKQSAYRNLKSAMADYLTEKKAPAGYTPEQKGAFRKSVEKEIDETFVREAKTVTGIGDPKQAVEVAFKDPRLNTRYLERLAVRIQAELQTVRAEPPPAEPAPTPAPLPIQPPGAVTPPPTPESAPTPAPVPVPPSLAPGWEKGLTRSFAFDPNSTQNEGRFRILPPGAIDPKTYFRRKSSTLGVSYVMGVPTEGGEATVQAIRFDKRHLTEEQAAKWWEENKQKFRFANEPSPAPALAATPTPPHLRTPEEAKTAYIQAYAKLPSKTATVDEAGEVVALGKTAGFTPDELYRQLLVARSLSHETALGAVQRSFPDFYKPFPGTQQEEPAAQVPQKVARIIQKEKVELTPQERTIAQEMRGEIDLGEAGRRIPNPALQEEGLTYEATENLPRWIGIPSSFPDYFKNKGYTKKETLSIIDRVLSGESLTSRQQSVFHDLLEGKKRDLEERESYYATQFGQLTQNAEAAGITPADIEEAERAGLSKAQSEIAEGEGGLPPEATEFPFGEGLTPSTEPAPPEKPTEAVPPEKPPWQMTRAEFRERNRQTAESQGTLGAQPFEAARFVKRADGSVEQIGEHQLLVEQALREGKPVPPEVLKDYPSLKQKGQPEPAPAPPQEVQAQIPGTEPKLPERPIPPKSLIQEEPGPLFKTEGTSKVSEKRGTLAPGWVDDKGNVPRAKEDVQFEFQAVRPGRPGRPAFPITQPGIALRSQFYRTGSLPLVNQPIQSPDDVAFIFGELTNQAQENFYVLALKEGRPLGIVHAHIGTVDVTLVETLRILTFPIQRKADAVYLIHNHPSGDPSPSQEDVALTHKARDVLAGTPINLLGHIVIEGGKFGFITSTPGAFWETRPVPTGLETEGRIPIFRQKLLKEKPYLLRTMRGPDDVAAYAKSLIDPTENQLMLLALDVRYQVVGNFPLPPVASPKLTFEIIRRAALVNARILVLAGTKKRLPTQQEFELLQAALKTRDFTLLDVLQVNVKSVHRPFPIKQSGEAVPNVFQAGRVAESPGTYADLPTDPESEFGGEPIRFGGMDRVKPLEMPEIVRLAHVLMGDYPTLKKLPENLGRFVGTNFGRIKIHPWLFIGEEGLKKLQEELQDYLLSGKNPPRVLIEKVDFLARNIKQRGFNLAEKVLAHEVGHLIDWLPEQFMSRGNAIGHALSAVKSFLKATFGELVNKELRQELKALTQYWKPFDEKAVKPSYKRYRYSTKELYADFVSVLLNDPPKAKELAPKFYQAFFDYLDRKPEVKQAYADLLDLLNGADDDLLKSREQDIAGMFERGDQILAERRLQAEARRKSLWFRIKLMVIDRNTGILEKRNQIADRTKLNPELDPKYLIEEKSAISSIAKSYMDDLEPVYKKVAQEGLDWHTDVGQRIFLERVIGERVDIANPLGHTPLTAQQQLDYMKRRLGEEKFKRLEGIVLEIRDWFKKINALGEEDLFTEEQLRKMRENEVYATFRSLDYIKEYVAAGLIPQKGTLGEVANPATGLVLKGIALIRAAHHNRIRKNVATMFQTHFPKEFPEAKVFYTPESGLQVEQKEGFGTIVWREKGKWRAVFADPYIADSLNYHDSGAIAAAGNFLDLILLNKPVFRPLYITFNLGFQSYNLVRDFLRFWKNTPNLSLGKALVKWGEAVKPAVRRVTGEFDPIIQQMEREAALNITFNDYISGATDEDKEIETILDRYGLFPKNKKTMRLFRPIAAALDGIKLTGDVIETIPKVAGYQAMENLPAKERAYRVRNLVGTPNFKRRGEWYQLYNNIFLFSNIYKEGVRGDWEAAFKDPKTRAGFWWKTAMTTFLPKAIMFLAALGFFGKQLKDGMDAATEYDKTNYVVIPVGEDENGKTVYSRIPQDETGRFLGGLFWKTLHLNQPESVTDVLKLSGGQLPSLAPALELYAVWFQLLTGTNPRDFFRGREILTEDEMKAGGLERLTPVVLWSFSQLGNLRLDIRDAVRNESMLEKVVTSTPILGRWIRVSNYGQAEIYRKEIERTQAQEARERLQEKAKIREGIREGLPPAVAARGIRDKQERREFQRSYQREQLKAGDDPITRALASATSNEQKLAVLEKVGQSFDTRAEYVRFLTQLRLSGVISKELMRDAILRSAREEAVAR